MSGWGGYLVMMGLLFAGCTVQGGLDNVASAIRHHAAVCGAAR